MCLKGQIGLCSGCTFIGTVKYARSVSLAPSSWTARPSLSALAHEFHLILLHCRYLIPVEGGECECMCVGGGCVYLDGRCHE